MTNSNHIITVSTRGCIVQSASSLLISGRFLFAQALTSNGLRLKVGKTQAMKFLVVAWALDIPRFPRYVPNGIVIDYADCAQVDGRLPPELPVPCASGSYVNLFRVYSR